MNALPIATYCLYALITILGINGRDSMALPLMIQGQLWRLWRPERADLPDLSNGSNEFPYIPLIIGNIVRVQPPSE